MRPLAVSLSLAVCLAVLSSAFGRSAALTPQPRTDSGSWQRRLDAKAKLVAAGGSKVVLLGDETVHFLEENWGGQPVWERYFKDAPYAALNLGFSGDKTGNLLWRITEGKQLDGYEAKAVFVSIGANDIVFTSAKVPEIVAAIGKIVETVKAKQPKATVVLSAIRTMNLKHGPAVLKKYGEANHALAKLADGERTIWCGYDTWFRLDEEGYLRWTGAIVPKINEALRK